MNVDENWTRIQGAPAFAVKQIFIASNRSLFAKQNIIIIRKTFLRTIFSALSHNFSIIIVIQDL